MIRGAAAVALILAACVQGSEQPAVEVPGGSPELGRQLVYGHACGSCHVIPGVAGANAFAGPPLTNWAERSYIAGKLWNTPENLMAWIMDPQAIEPGTGMPNVGVTEEEARDIAAYLFTIGNPDPLGPPHPLPYRWLERMGKGAKPRDPDPYAAPIVSTTPAPVSDSAAPR